MNQLVKNISTVKMFPSNIVVSKLLFICFICKQILTEAAPGVGSYHHFDHVGHHRMCHHSRHKYVAASITDDDSTIDQGINDSIFKHNDETGSSDANSSTKATSTINNGEETKNITDIKGPILVSRTILTVAENCKMGQKRDRKGRCRTTINVR